MHSPLRKLALACAVPLCIQAAVEAQVPTGDRTPAFVSPEVGADRNVTFRLHAPKAEAVRLVGGDIPGNNAGAALARGEGGVWQVTLGPLPAGAYRYHFNVDGVNVVDPRNAATSESNANTWSLVVVPGSKWFDALDVPHGAVAQVTYASKALGRQRRMHVYTPPGYERGEGRFPVLYLLHGALDCDASWSSVGRAGFILDNLLAQGRARPMIVVMPAGHTGPFQFGAGGGGAFERQMEEFLADFTRDVRPYVEAHYRVHRDRAHRAIAGLSMGGAQTLNVAFGRLEEYGYVGVFSSGIFGIAGGRAGAAPDTSWEERHAAVLDNSNARQGLKLVWFACGKEDFLLSTSRATVAMLRKHGVPVESQETEGGHTWLNWRDYLTEFVPKLFVE